MLNAAGRGNSKFETIGKLRGGNKIREQSRDPGHFLLSIIGIRVCFGFRVSDFEFSGSQVVQPRKCSGGGWLSWDWAGGGSQFEKWSKVVQSGPVRLARTAILREKPGSVDRPRDEWFRGGPVVVI